MHDGYWYVRVYYQCLFNKLNPAYPYDSVDIELYRLLPKEIEMDLYELMCSLFSSFVSIKC